MLMMVSSSSLPSFPLLSLPSFLPLSLQQVFKPIYKERFSSISNFVMVKFEDDMMVEPKETEVQCVADFTRIITYTCINTFTMILFIKATIDQ